MDRRVNPEWIKLTQSVRPPVESPPAPGATAAKSPSHLPALRLKATTEALLSRSPDLEGVRTISPAERQELFSIFNSLEPFVMASFRFQFKKI
jgi:hypothetical protein